jgi:hypothetical protein
MLRQETSLEVVVVVVKKGASAPIATLRDVVGKARDDETGEASHAPLWLP